MGSAWGGSDETELVPGVNFGAKCRDWRRRVASPARTANRFAWLAGCLQSHFI